MKLIKRTWHYLHQPDFYEVCCIKDAKRKPGTEPKHKVTWSEYEGLIWCFICEKDMKGFEGLFAGPINWQAAKMLYGDSVFYRYNMVKNVVEIPVLSKTGNIIYRKSSTLTNKLVKPKGR